MGGSESNYDSSITTSLQEVSHKECTEGYTQSTPEYGKLYRINDMNFLTQIINCIIIL